MMERIACVARWGSARAWVFVEARDDLQQCLRGSCHALATDVVDRGVRRLTCGSAAVAGSLEARCIGSAGLNHYDGSLRRG